MEYGLTLVTPPAIEPLTLREIKRHCNIADQFVRDDVYLMEQLLPQCRREFEEYCGRAVISQSWLLTLDCPPRAILLPRGHVQSITEVAYEDQDGNQVVLTPTDYRLVNSREPATLHMNYPEVWPQDRTKNLGGFTIEFVAGYGDTAADVPPGVKGCILKLIESAYRFRGIAERPESPYVAEVFWFALDQWRVGDEFDQYVNGLTPGVAR